MSEPKDISFWTGKRPVVESEQVHIFVEAGDIEAVTPVARRLAPGFMNSMATLLAAIEKDPEVLPQGEPINTPEEPSDQVDSRRFNVLIALFLLNEGYKSFQNACAQKGINSSLDFGSDDYGYRVKINLSRIGRPKRD